MSHPAACPYCGGTIANQVCADYQLRPARLNSDGSVTIGEFDQGVDFDGAMLLHCYNCSSTYVQPAVVTEHYDSDLADPIDAAWDFGKRPPGKDDPGYVGNTVTWIAAPQVNGQDNAVHDALKAMLVCTLDETHSAWMAEHDPIALRQLRGAIVRLQHVLELNGLDTLEPQRI
jgi:hypothetical protein